MEREELLEEWRSAAGRVFWGIVIVSFAGIFADIYDSISNYMEMLGTIEKYIPGLDWGIEDNPILKIGIPSKVIVVIGYVLYFTGLTSFAEIQQSENTTHYAYSARSALVLLLITSVIGFVFSFIDNIPVVGMMCRFIVWLLSVIGYFKMKKAYGGLMNCDDLSDRAKSGAENVKNAASYMLIYLFMPLILFVIAIFFLLLFLSSGHSMTSDLQSTLNGIKALFLTFCFIGVCALLYMLILRICAFIWPMVGWYKIKNGGPADVAMVEKIEHAGDVVKEDTLQTVDMETVEPAASEGVYEYEDSDDNKKKWYIGGAAAAVLIAAIVCFFVFSGNSKNNPLDVQKPKWEKFVKVNESNVKLYKEADVSSAYIQFAVENCECDMPDERYVWSDDKAPRGYNVNDYDVETNTVYPVLDENDGWYRVHFGIGEIQEAYIQKTSCEEVKPEPITKKIIEKVYGNDKGACKFVEKGEFANLFILREPFGFGVEENVSVGVLIDGCIVMPAECLCFPQESDSADVSIFNASNSSEYKLWHLNCPSNYWEETPDAEFPRTFNVNNLTESDIQKMVMALRPQGSTFSTVYYYFPSVATDRFIEFEYSFSPAVASEVEEDKAVAKYEVQNNKLMAEINGEMIDTGIDGEFGIDLMLTSDLDDDGSMECVIQVGTGGNIVESPFVLTYDLDEEKFVKAGNLEFADTPTIEEKDGKTLLLQRAGLRWIRYGMEDHKLKRVEDEVKMVGSVRNTIEMDNIYGEDEEGEVKVKQDFDGDGNDDEFTFSRGMSHAAGYGAWMGMNTVVLSDGTSYDLGLAAAKFKILNETTNGMPDIIGDDYLYRWNGSSYDSYGWDGTNLVKTY